MMPTSCFCHGRDFARCDERPSFLSEKEGKTDLRCCDTLKIRGRKPFGAYNALFSLLHSVPTQERLAVRSAILLHAKILFLRDAFCGCFTTNLYSHRRDADKLSS